MNNYWYCKVIIGLLAFIAMSNNGFGMSPEDLFPTVAFIQGKKTREVKIDNIAYEVWLKKQGEENPRPYKEDILGTGFFLSEGENVYLVTARHIAKHLQDNVLVTVHGKGDKPISFTLTQLTGNDSNYYWTYNEEADIAIIKIKLLPNIKTLDISLFQHDFSNFSKARPITIIGFPLALGVKGKFSPIIINSKVASGLLRYRWGDKNAESDFIILENPSVSGFSGAPVIALGSINLGSATLAAGKLLCLGLVHGTISDDTGGKFAAIVPVKYITETLELLK